MKIIHKNRLKTHRTPPITKSQKNLNTQNAHGSQIQTKPRGRVCAPTPAPPGPPPPDTRKGPSEGKRPFIPAYTRLLQVIQFADIIGSGEAADAATLHQYMKSSDKIDLNKLNPWT